MTEDQPVEESPDPPPPTTGMREHATARNRAATDRIFPPLTGAKP